MSERKLELGWVPYDADSPVGSSILFENGEQWMFDERIPLRHELALLHAENEELRSRLAVSMCFVPADWTWSDKGGG